MKLKDKQLQYYFLHYVLKHLNSFDRRVYFLGCDDTELMRLLIKKYRGVISGEETAPGIPMELFDKEEK